MALLIPEYLQTKTYSAARVRGVLMDSAIQEGVVGGGDLKVTQRASGGANMSVDIAEGAGFVKGDLTARQGLYHVYNDAAVNIAIGSNTSGNPRLDQIILRVLDSQDGLAGADLAQLEVLPGTATAGATLDNRNGAAALPMTAMRIADVLVVSGASSIVNAVIRDRRPWARGAFFVVDHPNTTDLTYSFTSYGTVFTWNDPRIECTGNPLRITLGVSLQQGSITGYSLWVPHIDGTAQAVAQRWFYSQATGVGNIDAPSMEWVVTPTAGSHILGVYTRMTGGNAVVFRSGNSLPQMVIEEIMRPSASNS